MFRVEGGTSYYVQPSGACAEARRLAFKEQRTVRVLTYPDGVEHFVAEPPPKPVRDIAALTREVFG